MATTNTKDQQLKEDIKKLVIERIKASSKDLAVMIGTTTYSREEMLENVEEENKVGKEIIEIQMEYLRDMANGAIYQE